MAIISSQFEQDAFVYPVYGSHGQYTLSPDVKIPYFSTLMPIERTVSEIKIAEEVNPSLENRWTLSELFQREVDRDRVYKDIVNGYLKDPNKLKFFNAITVVLIPRNDAGQLLDRFNQTETKSPSIPFEPNDPTDSQWAEVLEGESSGAQLCEFGGVQYVRLGNQARLRWDPESVHAVAVDGQHRLAALKLYRQDGELSSVAKQTSIPVLFLLLDAAAGYKSPANSQERSIRMLSREIFTDLNKNARRVDRARELILDDWSLVARCCRTLITNETAMDSRSELPLTLIRWQEDNNRFDQSYFLNSLVNLEQVTSIVLDLQPPKDPMEKAQVEKFIDSIERAVGTDGQLVANGQTLREAYSRGFLEDDNPIAPFSRLPSSFLEVAVEGFRLRHKPWVVSLLTQPGPYKNLLDEARSNDMIEGEFGKYWAQTKRHREKISGELGHEWRDERIARAESTLSALKQGNWLFKAIFQKAVIRLGKEACVDNASDPRLGGIESIIGFLNHLDSTGVLDIEAELQGSEFGLWTFIALNPGNQKIKVNKAVENRLLALLRIWYYVYVSDRSGGEDKSDKELARLFRAASNTIDWPDCAQSIAIIDKCIDSKAFFGDDSDQLSDERKQERVRSRTAALIASVRG